MLWRILLVMNALLVGLVSRNAHPKRFLKVIFTKSIPISVLIVVHVLMSVRWKRSVPPNLHGSIKTESPFKKRTFFLHLKPLPLEL